MQKSAARSRRPCMWRCSGLDGIEGTERRGLIINEAVEEKAPCLRKDLGQQIAESQGVETRQSSWGDSCIPRTKRGSLHLILPGSLFFQVHALATSEPGSLLKIRFQNFCIRSFGRRQQLTVWSPRGRAERRQKGPLGKFTEYQTIGDLTQQSLNAPPR